MPPPPRAGALSDDARLTSVVYIGPKSRTERPRKTKIGTEVAHATRDSDTTFNVKKSKVNLQGAGAFCGAPPPRTACYYPATFARQRHEVRHARTKVFSEVVNINRQLPMYVVNAKKLEDTEMQD